MPGTHKTTLAVSVLLLAYVAPQTSVFATQIFLHFVRTHTDLCLTPLRPRLVDDPIHSRAAMADNKKPSMRQHTFPPSNALTLRPRQQVARPSTSPERAVSGQRITRHANGRGAHDLMWNTITRRMNEAGIPTDMLTPQRLAFILPDPNQTYSDNVIQTLDDLCNDAITVSNARVAQVLAISAPIGQGATGSMPAPGKFIHYMRTFQLCVGDLRDVIKQLRSEGNELDTLAQWDIRIQLLRPHDTVYVRYIGRSQKVSAHERYLHDMKRGGFYGEWLRLWKAGARSPIWGRSFTVNEFTLATGDPITIPVERAMQVDACEQALIALFNPAMLLNRESGGRNLHFVVPGRYAAIASQQLQVEGFTKMLRYAAAPTAAQKAQVQAWSLQLKSFSDSHLSRLGLTEFPISYGKAQVYSEQGEASTLPGAGDGILLVMADVPPYNMFPVLENGWRSGTGRSLATLQHMASLVWQTEPQGRGMRERDVLSFLVDKHHLPLVDLRMWPAEVEFAQAYSLTQQYMSAVRPLIVAAQGRAPALAC